MQLIKWSPLFAAAVLLTAPAMADDGASKTDQTVKPDNTSINQRDRDGAEPTADNQSNSSADIQLAAKIRRALVKDRSLSVNGHNVKIIAQDGAVTLKGPVKTADEKIAIEACAAKIAGRDNITSELSVQP